MNALQTNIDDVRTEIMRLEAEPHFNADAWSRVLADLSTAGRFSALDDAKRRMETARSNQPAVAVETDYNVDGNEKTKPEYSLTVNVSPDCAPETLLALGIMAKHVIDQFENKAEA